MLLSPNIHVHKCTQYTHVNCQNKLLFCMRFICDYFLSALLYLFILFIWQILNPVLLINHQGLDCWKFYNSCPVSYSFKTMEWYQRENLWDLNKTSASSICLMFHQGCLLKRIEVVMKDMFAPGLLPVIFYSCLVIWASFCFSLWCSQSVLKWCCITSLTPTGPESEYITKC